MTPAPVWGPTVRGALPQRAQRYWVPVGANCLRQGGVVLTPSASLPAGLGSITAWFVVPLVEADAFWAAWQRAGSDPSSPELAPWRELLTQATPSTPERTFVTRRGSELRYRAPGVRFGDPRDG